MDRETAFRILNQCGITRGANFHTLSSDKVEALLVEANRAKYRKPSNANGSRGRYFYARVCRAASRHGDK